MSRGKRFDESESKLNIKKVFAVIIAIIVIIMFIFIIKNLLTKDKNSGKITSSTYFTVFKDNKWGVIDSNGDTVIDPSYKEMIVVPNNKSAVFICTYDVNYETGEYKTKVLNQKNEEIFTEYDKVEAIQNKDNNNNLWYEENVLKVEKNGKFGIINLAGKEILPVEYDEISPTLEIKNSYKIKKDNKYGIANAEGKVVIEPLYSDIDVIGEDNKSGYIVKDEKGKYGVIDYSNTLVLQIKYDAISKIHTNDLYVVTENSKQKLIRKDGTEVLTTGFDGIKNILSNENEGIIFEKSGKYGVMNLQGQNIIGAEYDFLKEAKSDIFVAKKGEKYGIINNNKEEKLAFNYNNITYNDKANIYIAEDDNLNSYVFNGNLEQKLTGILIEFNVEKGYIKMRDDNGYKHYNLKFEEKQESDIFPNRTLFLSKKDGKYGFTDKNGKVIVDYIYDDAIEQNDYGFAAINKDGKWGSINSKGTVVQEPMYNLDDYLLIDFIGRWHFGLDVNMNYYNQQ